MSLFAKKVECSFKCRAQIPSVGHHTWPYVTSLSLFTLISKRIKIALRKISMIGLFLHFLFSCLSISVQ